MGYTQYWTIKKPITKGQMTLLQSDMLKIEGLFIAEDIEAEIAECYTTSVVKLADGMGEGDRVDYGDHDKIAFNGIEEGDLGHETFGLRVGDEGFEFCKTARKPYDLAVCMMLIALKNHLKDSVEISTDGGDEEWEQPIKLYKKLFPTRKIYLNFLG